MAGKKKITREEQLIKDNKELKEALCKYGNHHKGCQLLCIEPYCTCGWIEIIQKYIRS